MQKQSNSMKKTSLNAAEQYELNQWLEQNEINSNNLRRSFTDVLPLARLLSRFYPELIDLNYYPPRNSVQNKLCNWESFNKRVLARLGVHVTRDQMVRVARSVPGSIDQLLFNIMRVQMAAERNAREAKDSTDDDDGGEEPAENDDDASETAQKEEEGQMPKTLQQAQAVMKKGQGRASAVVAAAGQTVAAVATAGAVGGPVAAVAAASARRNRKLSAASSDNAAATTSKTRQRGELPNDLPKKHNKKCDKTKKRMVLYSHYMQAVKQLQRKNAKIARFDQWSAHLENMLQLKCERIDELQQQVALAVRRLKPLRKNPGTQRRKRSQARRKQHSSSGQSCFFPLVPAPLAEPPIKNVRN